MTLSRKLAIGAICVTGILASSYALGLRYNTSESLPLGFYHSTSEIPEVGKLVWLCPLDTPVFQQAKKRGYIAPGPCPGNYGHLMKALVAGPGDLVNSTPEGLFINGQLLRGSKPMREDGQGRVMPQLVPSSFVLAKDSWLVQGTASPASFDSRYFGLIPSQNIKSVITPIFTWKS